MGSRVLQELGAGVWDGGGVGAAIAGVGDPVDVSPQNQGGQFRRARRPARVGSHMAVPA